MPFVTITYLLNLFFLFVSVKYVYFMIIANAPLWLVRLHHLFPLFLICVTILCVAGFEVYDTTLNRSSSYVVGNTETIANCIS